MAVRMIGHGVERAFGNGLRPVIEAPIVAPSARRRAYKSVRWRVSIVRSSAQLDERWGAATQVSFAHTFIEKGENALPANYLVQSHRGPYAPT